MHHVHPLMAAYSRDSDHFPHHPEMVIWPVKNEGLLVRVLARECLMLDPNAFRLNDRALVDGPTNRDEIEFISDSDDLFAISLMPLGKDMDWCVDHQVIDYSWLARWWLHYDGPLNDIVAGTKVRVHYADPTKSEWRKAEFCSDLFVYNAAIHREALRAWRALRDPELQSCRRTPRYGDTNKGCLELEGQGRSTAHFCTFRRRDQFDAGTKT